MNCHSNLDKTFVFIRSYEAICLSIALLQLFCFSQKYSWYSCSFPTELVFQYHSNYKHHEWIKISMWNITISHNGFQMETLTRVIRCSFYGSFVTFYSNVFNATSNCAEACLKEVSGRSLDYTTIEVPQSVRRKWDIDVIQYTQSQVIDIVAETNYRILRSFKLFPFRILLAFS